MRNNGNGNNAISRRNDGYHAANKSSSLASTTGSIPTALAKQCLQLHFPGRRYTNEAVELSSEFLKLFVLEARRRAAIEAECEAEADINENDEDGSDNNNIHQHPRASNKNTRALEIRADHISKIAAELLLDIS